MTTEKSTESTESTEVQTWEEVCKAKAAQQAAQRAALSTGPKFLSFRGGILNVDKVPIPDNKLDVVVLTFIAENSYYRGKFDPTATQTPLCYAVYQSLEDMWPSDDVKEKQADNCKECPHYQWGSDPQGGRGKACKTRYRIAVIPGSIESEQDILGGELRYATLPVTSCKDFDTFASKCEMVLGRPMFGVVSTLSVVPDAKTQYRVGLNPIQSIPGHLMNAVLRRIDEAEKAITYDYALTDDEHTAAPAKPLKK